MQLNAPKAQIKAQPRILKTRLGEVERWLENNFYRKGRDWDCAQQGIFVTFTFKDSGMQRIFERQFTRYYR